MSEFDLRKFLAEQKAPKEENIQEETIEEVEVNEEEVEETYHEGEEANEGDMDESVVAGVAALIGGSIAAGKVLDYIADKYPEAIKKFMKATGGAVRGSGKTGSGGSYITQEGEEEMEEQLKESTFKASIKEILNS